MILLLNNYYNSIEKDIENAKIVKNQLARNKCLETIAMEIEEVLEPKSIVEYHPLILTRIEELRPILESYVNDIEGLLTTNTGLIEKIETVYSVAAMCYYLHEAGFNIKSRSAFIREEIILEYPSFTFASVNTKCSEYKKPDFRALNRNAIEKAITLMVNSERFNLGRAIELAKIDLAKIDVNKL